MPLPNPDEYANALQNLRQTVADEELREGRLALTPLGLPMLWSGGFADVYRVHCPRTGNTWAVKCFTREIPAREERYRQIAAHLEQARLPFTMEFKYLQRGVLVNGAWLPVVKMRWVDGHLLNEFVEGHLDQPQRLRQFLHLWVKMADRLRAADTAHADLQHGNVLLVPVRDDQLALRLIDYDGMYLPTLAHVRSGESGHAAYQHPQRLRQGMYNGEVDRFPQLAIYCAIHCVVTEGPPLWERFNNGDNLLFREHDFREPAASDLFHTLWESRNKHSRALAGRLVLACNAPLEHTPLLCEVVNGRRARPLTPDEEAAVCEVLQVGERRFIPAGGATSSPLREDLATRSDGIGTASESQTDWGLSDAPDPQATGDQWHFMVADQIVGPVSRDDLKRLAREGSVKPATLVRQPAGTEWMEARAVEGLLEPSESLDAAQPQQKSPSPTLGTVVRAGGARLLKSFGGAAHFLDGVLARLVGQENDLLRVFLWVLLCSMFVTAGWFTGTVLLPALLAPQLQLEPLPEQWVEAGSTVTVTVLPDDTEYWKGRLQFALGPGAPPGAAIDAQSGEFAWTPSEDETSGMFPIGVTVECPKGQQARTNFAIVVTRPWRPTATEIVVDLGQEVTLEMVLIPAGEFIMGSPDSDGFPEASFDEKPQHRVRITRPFYLGKYPVTQEQWEAMMERNPSGCNGSKNPVECVSWYDCHRFLARLNERHATGGGTFSLPTEAQWEYACRAGTTTRYPFGDDEGPLGLYAWYSWNSGRSRTHWVGGKKPNAWGLHDMIGNVREWCADRYDMGYYANSPVDDPLGPTSGSYARVARGGDWLSFASHCRSAKRSSFSPGTQIRLLGFRVALVSAVSRQAEQARYPD